MLNRKEKMFKFLIWYFQNVGEIYCVCIFIHIYIRISFVEMLRHDVRKGIIQTRHLNLKKTTFKE